MPAPGKRTTTKLNADQKAKLAMLYLEGVRTSALAEMFNVSAYNITHYVLPKLGVTPRLGRPKDNY